MRVGLRPLSYQTSTSIARQLFVLVTMYTFPNGLGRAPVGAPDGISFNRLTDTTFPWRGPTNADDAADFKLEYCVHILLFSINAGLA